MVLDPQSHALLSCLPSLPADCREGSSEGGQVESTLASLCAEAARSQAQMIRWAKSGRLRLELQTLEPGEDPCGGVLGTSLAGSRIQRYIARHMRKRLVGTTTLGGRAIRMEIGLFSEPTPSGLSRASGQCLQALAWLDMSIRRAPEACARRLKIALFPTPFKRQLPANRTSTLGPEQVNGGYTYGCAEVGLIVVFRQEEWFKVLIHETFHCFGFDATAHSAELSRLSESLFPVRANHAVDEAYAETWARILNCVFLQLSPALEGQGGAGPSGDVLHALALERQFSLLQLAKILDFAGLDYVSLRGGEAHTGERMVYRERTSVVAYYVLAGVLMSNYRGFINWCAQNNPALFPLDGTGRKTEQFGDLLRSSASKPALVVCLSQVEASLKGIGDAATISCRRLRRTSRMSAIEAGAWEIDLA
jgi:hypothetical protein